MVEDVDVDPLDRADESDLVGVRRRRATSNSEPSSPESPTAGCPWRFSRWTMSEFSLPTRTIFATSTVSASETRRPSWKLHLHTRAAPCSRVISGPPPWTIIGLRPTYLSRTTSVAKASRRPSSTHRRAAVLDHRGSAVELADVGQGLEQGLDARGRRSGLRGALGHVVYSAFMRSRTHGQGRRNRHGHMFAATESERQLGLPGVVGRTRRHRSIRRRSRPVVTGQRRPADWATGPSWGRGRRARS